MTTLNDDDDVDNQLCDDTKSIIIFYIKNLDTLMLFLEWRSWFTTSDHEESSLDRNTADSEMIRITESPQIPIFDL